MRVIYSYNGAENVAYVSPLIDDDLTRYAVLFDGNIITILPAQIPNDRTIWIQKILPGDAVWPQELVQALGDGIAHE